MAVQLLFLINCLFICTLKNEKVKIQKGDDFEFLLLILDLPRNGMPYK